MVELGFPAVVQHFQILMLELGPLLADLGGEHSV
jgi:hypothetical protein